jgi:hypothetical protein
MAKKTKRSASTGAAESNPGTEQAAEAGEQGAATTESANDFEAVSALDRSAINSAYASLMGVPFLSATPLTGIGSGWSAADEVVKPKPTLEWVRNEHGVDVLEVDELDMIPRGLLSDGPPVRRSPPVRVQWLDRLEWVRFAYDPSQGYDRSSGTMHLFVARLLDRASNPAFKDTLRQELGLEAGDAIEMRCADGFSSMKLRLYDLPGVEFDMSGPREVWLDYNNTTIGWEGVEDPKGWDRSRLSGINAFAAAVKGPGSLSQYRSDTVDAFGKLWFDTLRTELCELRGKRDASSGTPYEAIGPEQLQAGFKLNLLRGVIHLHGGSGRELCNVQVRLSGRLARIIPPSPHEQEMARLREFETEGLARIIYPEVYEQPAPAPSPKVEESTSTPTEQKGGKLPDGTWTGPLKALRVHEGVEVEAAGRRRLASQVLGLPEDHPEVKRQATAGALKQAYFEMRKAWKDSGGE